MIERKYIQIVTYPFKQKDYSVEAFIFGQFAVHRTPGEQGISTVTHIASGYSIAEYSSIRIAIRFAIWLDQTFDFDPIAARSLNGSYSAIDKDIRHFINMRRLHACFIPRKSNMKWIKKNAPHWLQMRHSDLVLRD